MNNRLMLPIVVYSHSDYIDILNIQTHYLASYTEKILLINDTIDDSTLNKLKTYYSQVITYDDSLPYAGRLLSLNEVASEYIMLLHDMDILIRQDIDVINYLYKKAAAESMDRIDLQNNLDYTYDDPGNIPIDVVQCDASLFRARNPGSYIYNVNPSIWKLSTLISVMQEHKNETYRSIETSGIQSTCSNLQMYKIHGKTRLVCGYYCSHPFFQFLHLTHGGKYLPEVENNFVNELRDEYKFIRENFLKDTVRQFNVQR